MPPLVDAVDDDNYAGDDLFEKALDYIDSLPNSPTKSRRNAANTVPMTPFVGALKKKLKVHEDHVSQRRQEDKMDVDPPGVIIISDSDSDSDTNMSPLVTRSSLFDVQRGSSLSSMSSVNTTPVYEEEMNARAPKRSKEGHRPARTCSPSPSKIRRSATQMAYPDVSTKNFYTVDRPATPRFAAPEDVSSVFRLQMPENGNIPQLVGTSNCATEWPTGDLSPYIIAHSSEIQPLLDSKRLSWGVIYEIARGVLSGLWKWEDVTSDKLDILKGSHVDRARHVSTVMKKDSLKQKATFSELWAEFDREERAIVENNSRGLGLMGEWCGKSDWYGGRIQQVVRMLKSKDPRSPNPFKFILEKPTMTRSNRFSREVGSRRILQLRISDDMLMGQNGDKCRAIVSTHKFVLCGRVFIPFHAKEGSVYMVEVSEDYERTPDPFYGDQYRRSFMDFVKWHNPLELNGQQPTRKWAARWALGLSTSVPALQFSHENIKFVDDVYALDVMEGQKAPAEKVMTDGCGFINGAALTRIMRSMGYSSRPTAVQGRIAGSKGMWVLHPDPLEHVADGPAKIWIRNSQDKINLPPLEGIDRAHLIFDLLAPSRVTVQSRLNSQTIANLAHNGVPFGVLENLMEEGLSEEVEKLTRWDGPGGMVPVWNAVEKAGKVMPVRLAKYLAGRGRALGVGRLRPGELEGDIDMDMVDNAVQQHVAKRNAYSGAPIGVFDSTLELLQAGFHPLSSPVLYKKMRTILTLVIDDYVKTFHIPIKESLEAYIIPDPFGVLEEGQIHCRSSETLLDSNTGALFETVRGQVLVCRNPTRLPSDVQKVEAISHPLLYDYYDVIVFSTKGSRSLASYLGGGDYDGDTVLLTWCKDLVENFSNSPFSEPPRDLSSQFEKDVESVVDLLARTSVTPQIFQSELQRVLVSGIAETKVGLYSKFHDVAVYQYGYASPIAIRLAYMFTTCLDSNKTGLRVKSDVFARDSKAFGSVLPLYIKRLASSSDTMSQSWQSKKLVRPYTRFILDTLVDAGHKLRDMHLANFHKLEALMAREIDHSLTEPYFQAERAAEIARTMGFDRPYEELQAIGSHVTSVHKRWVFEVAKSMGSQQTLMDANNFWDTIYTLKASYAYKFVAESSPDSTFPLTVAFAALCQIKAQSLGAVPCVRQFAESMVIAPSFLKAFSRAEDDD